MPSCTVSDEVAVMIPEYSDMPTVATRNRRLNTLDALHSSAMVVCTCGWRKEPVDG